MSGSELLPQVNVTNRWCGSSGFAAYLWNARGGESAAGRSLRSLQMSLARAWSRLLALEADQGLLGLAEIGLESSHFDAPAAKALRAGVSAARAVGLALQDDCVAALPIALSCIEGAPVSHSRLAAVARTVCRLAYWKLGDFARFHDVGAANSMAHEARDVGLLAFDRALEAAIELQQLRLGAANRLAQDVLAMVPRRPCVRTGFASLWATALLFQLQYEQGTLAEAEESVRDLLPLIRDRGCAEAVLRIYPLLAKIARHRSHADLAMLTLTEAAELGQRRGWSRLVAACLEERVELLVRAGCIDEAEACFDRMHAQFAGHCGSRYVQVAVRRHVSLARARISLARAPSFKTLATLKRLHREATAGGDLYLASQLTVRVAEAFAALNETADATETLMDALELGANVGMYQSFLDGGPLVGALLRSIADGLAYGTSGLTSASAEGERHRRFLLPYVKSVLRGWQMANQAGTGEGARGALRLTGPLSPRERRILQLISRGHSNKRVARELSIAPETVKSHAKHIFVKLGAQTRMEAVSRATTLGLI
jgi:ATP/maltotriose-dependent transcriptional regulator MalT